MSSQFVTETLTQFINARSGRKRYSDIKSNIPVQFLSHKSWMHLTVSLWVTLRVMDAIFKPYSGESHGYMDGSTPSANAKHVAIRDMEFARNIESRFKNRVQSNLLISGLIKQYMGGCVHMRSCTSDILLRTGEWRHLAEIITKAMVVFMFPNARTMGLHLSMLDCFNKHNKADKDGRNIDGVNLFEMLLYSCRLDRYDSTSVYVDLYMYISQFYDCYVTKKCRCSADSIPEIVRCSYHNTVMTVDRPSIGLNTIDCDNTNANSLTVIIGFRDLKKMDLKMFVTNGNKIDNIINGKFMCEVVGTTLVLTNVPVLNLVIPLGDLWGIHGTDMYSRGYLINQGHHINTVDIFFSCSYIHCLTLGTHISDRLTKEQVNMNPLSFLMVSVKNTRTGVGMIECEQTMDNIRAETSICNIDLSKYSNKMCKIELIKYIKTAPFNAEYCDRLDTIAWSQVEQKKKLMSPITLSQLSPYQTQLVLFYTDFFRSDKTTPLEFLETEHSSIQRYMHLVPLPDIPGEPDLLCMEGDAMADIDEIESFIEEQGSGEVNHLPQSIADMLAEIDFCGQ